MTDRNDVYSWGRGYEGQLGVSERIEVAAKPNYVKGFFGVPVVYIAAGAFYSLAITHDNKLYGWGESRLGQLGLGVKSRMVRTPTYISVHESEETVGNKNVSSVSVKEEIPKLDTTEARIIYCSAGLGHTMAISDEGELYTWGFNNCGQLGIGDQKSRWEPVRVEKDIVGNLLPQIQKVVCSYYSTYAIDAFGNLYSWGKGYIGHKNLTIEDLPRKIELNTENRYYSDVFCNKDMVAFYAPIRVFSISPNCGPAYGGTLLSIIGTGFVYSDKLRVRFTYGDLNQESPCQYDSKTKTLYCRTPKFEGLAHPSIKFPCNCIISVTTDGMNYSECEESFKIYSNNIFLESVSPKSGSVKGGTQLELGIDIDDKTAQNLFQLTIGFQPAKKHRGNQGSRKELVQSTITKNQSIEETEEGKLMNRALNASQHSSAKLGTPNASPVQDDNPINPMDIGPSDPQLENDAWVCSAGFYEKGRIICIVPELDEYHPENLQFNVDIALNGQQFTGHPLKFRYYDIRIKEVNPPMGPSEGGTSLRLVGSGLYDSTIKRLKFTTESGNREVQATWERKHKSIGCVVPPLTWLFGGEEVPEDVVQKVIESGVKVSLTFNNQEWIDVPDFKYHDLSIKHIVYVENFAEDAQTEEEKHKLWVSEEPIEHPPAEATEEEAAKWREEREKKFGEEKEEAKRINAKMYIYGTNFVKAAGQLRLRFTLGEKIVDIAPIYKNKEKLA